MKTRAADFETMNFRDDSGKFPACSFPGGYAIRYLMADGETLCASCVNDKENPVTDGETFNPNEHADKSWHVETPFIHWEGPASDCAHCNAALPSEYGDPDDEDSQ